MSSRCHQGTRLRFTLWGDHLKRETRATIAPFDQRTYGHFHCDSDGVRDGDLEEEFQGTVMTQVSRATSRILSASSPPRVSASSAGPE